MIDTANLAAGMSEDDLKKVGRACHDAFEADDDSRSGWLRMHAEWLRLFYQTDLPKDPPWPGSSRESMPTLAEACTQFYSRSKKALFPSGESIIKAKPVGEIDQDSMKRAGRVGAHMNWQLIVRDRKYKRRKARLMFAAALHGAGFTKTYPNLTGGSYRPVVANVRAQDLVMPYGVGPQDIEDLERKTEIIHTSVAKTERLFASGFFIAPAKRFQGVVQDEPTRVHDKAHGLEPTGSVRQNDYARLLEQHCWLQLAGQELSEPYIVTLDAETKNVLRIAPRYELVNGEPQPIEYYTEYHFLPNPDGTYGLGYGHLIGRINTAINKLLRMTVDAGELATAGNMSGFIDDAIGMPAGDVELKLGKFIKARANGRSLREAIAQMSFPGPNNSLIEILLALLQRSDRLATVTEALTGQTEKVMQPTTILALIDQGLQVFTTVLESMIESQGDELQKVFRLNRLYCPAEEYFAVQDRRGGVRSEQIKRLDYQDDLQIMPVADPAQAIEQQKIARAEAEWQFAVQNPLIVQNVPALHAASRRYLEAIGSQNIDELLPPIPGIAPRVDDPRLENMAALQKMPLMPPVFPDQDHLIHLNEHETFFAIYAKMITPAGYPALMDHIQQHRMFVVMMAETPDALEALNGQADTVGPGGMVQDPMHPMAPMAPPGAMGAGGGGAGPVAGPGAAVPGAGAPAGPVGPSQGA